MANGWRNVKITAAGFKKHILPRLRPGYARTWAEYRKKHPEVTHMLMYGGEMRGASDKHGNRFNGPCGLATANPGAAKLKAGKLVKVRAVRVRTVRKGGRAHRVLDLYL